jgi:carboxymethylenebutenolidase
MAQANELRDRDGSLIPGHLVGARPEAIVLIHEIYGLNAQIRRVATRFAAEGFTTFAIDLYGGRVTEDDATGIQLALHLNWKWAIERVAAAVKALSRLGNGAKVGVLGFSFGGGLALVAASKLPDVAACVTFYGMPTRERGNLLQIRCKVQGHFGNYDTQNSRDRVDALEARLKEGGVGVEIHRYHTQHFFFNDTFKPPIYSPHNSEHAFRLTVAFLKRELGGGW